MKVDPPAEKAKYVTFSVQKALRLLQAFSMDRPQQSLVELAHATGLSVSTVHRLLATLEAEGFIERDSQNGHYRLAIKMFELGSIVLDGIELNVVGRPVLAKLATDTGDTTYLTVLSDDKALCIARIEGLHHSRSQWLTIGRHLPLHAGAASKVLLAHLPEDRVRQMLADNPLVPYTDKTITDLETFMSTLPQIRTQGYALSVEEVTVGIIAVAAPVLDYRGQVVAAITLSGAASRFGSDRLPMLIDKVREAGCQISIRSGYSPRFLS